MCFGPELPEGKVEMTCWRCGRLYPEDKAFVDYCLEVGEDYSIDLACGCGTPVSPSRAMRNPAEWAYYAQHNGIEFPFGEFDDGKHWTQPAEVPYMPRPTYESDPDGPFDDWDVSF